jgi:AcrR family transcriptional regulator
MAARNRDKILQASIELFNRSGTVATTTNHIAKHLGISPGNLYFHFRNKEAIVYELFEMMCARIYAVWNLEQGLSPEQFLDESFEIFWQYRFFHREMYHLRRQDRELSQLWKRHLNKCYMLLRRNYREWVRSGAMRDIPSSKEMRLLTNSILLSSTAYLGFFESASKLPSRKVLADGRRHVMQILSPYRLAGLSSYAPTQTPSVPTVQ